MDGATVADISRDKIDLAGNVIEVVFSKVSGLYAVYGTSERVTVQFADDPKLGSDQRLVLSTLSPVRGEINGLLGSWRRNSYINQEKRQARAKYFDRRTADALTVALQGDPDHALDLLKAVQIEILDERTSAGRAEYLLVAAISAFILTYVVGMFSGPSNPDAPVHSFVGQNQIWLATALGCLGALFSIALGIRNRDIRPDLLRRDNIVDAVLRILIGAVSAIILFSLFKSHLVAMKLGETEISLDGTVGAATHMAIIVAFLAGFSERLVGNFLGSAVLGSIAGAATNNPVDLQSPQTRRAASELNPLGTEPTKTTLVGLMPPTSTEPTHNG